MFHFKHECASLNEAEYKKRIRAAFDNFCTDKSASVLNKTDFKCAWLYLFGYKISKVSKTNVSV